MKNVVTILGAGFSKSFNDGMPLLNDLTSIISKLDISSEYNSKLNFEELLTLLSINSSWKIDQEKHRDLALYHEIIVNICNYVYQKEYLAFQKNIPNWIKDFVTIAHNYQMPIITFNYDTIIERVALSLLEFKSDSNPEYKEVLNLFNLYKAPIASINSRYNFDWSVTEQSTFHLLKVHGSLNWYTNEDNRGSIFYLPIYKDNPDYKNTWVCS